MLQGQLCVLLDFRVIKSRPQKLGSHAEGDTGTQLEPRPRRPALCPPFVSGSPLFTEFPASGRDHLLHIHASCPAQPEVLLQDSHSGYVVDSNTIPNDGLGCFSAVLGWHLLSVPSVVTKPVGRVVCSCVLFPRYVCVCLCVLII